MSLEGVGTTRLIGVNAPEEGRCGANAATRFTRRQLQDKRVKYELGKNRKDRWGRTLAYLSRGGTMHNLALVEQGYAKALTIGGNDKYANRFEAAEREAKQQEEGPLADCAQKREERARAKERTERAEQAERLARRLRAAEKRAKEELRQDRGGGDGSGASRSGDGGAPKKLRRRQRSDPERTIRRSDEPRRRQRRAVR